MKELTEETRHILKTPLGELLDDAEVVALLRGKAQVISVGDFCSDALLRNGISPSIVIYDHRCLRKPVESGIGRRLDAYDGEALRAANPAGFITDELVGAVKKVLAAGKGKILVDGEEDLAALVVLMRAKDGTFVAYGQPNEGVVLIEVDAVVRKRAAAIFAKMKEVER